MSQPNRLERVWPQVSKEILAKWNRLTPTELEDCRYQYDLIVDLIHRTYYPGRSPLTMEGDIRDWINEKIYFYETNTFR